MIKLIQHSVHYCHVLVRVYKGASSFSLLILTLCVHVYIDGVHTSYQ